MLPWTLNDIIKAGISYFRIKKFLNEKEIDPTKGILNKKYLLLSYYLLTVILIHFLVINKNKDNIGSELIESNKVFQIDD